MRLQLVSLAGLVFVFPVHVLGAVTDSPMAVHERIGTLPAGVVQKASTTTTSSLATQEITLRIALAHSDPNLGGLEDRVYAVSDPASVLYGQHLSTEEISAFVAPSPSALTAVKSWLSAYSPTVTSVSPAGDILQITLPVSTANRLLATTFSEYTHTATDSTLIRATEYSVPAAIQKHIQYIHPVVSFAPPLAKLPNVKASAPSVKRRHASRTVPASCAETATVACLQDFYNLPRTPATHSSQGNILGVPAWGMNYLNDADLTQYLETFTPSLVGSNYTLVEIFGGQNDQRVDSASPESDMDIELALSLAPGVPVQFISVGQQTTDAVGGLMDFNSYILSLPVAERPTVISISYGYNDETEFTLPVATGLCNSYTQMAAAGISVLIASGDGGVGGGAFGLDCTTFLVPFPSECPFITAVGGTVGQTAWSGSSGGFSNLFPTPKYQVDAGVIPAYVAALGSEYAGLYNSSGRGYPDLAAQADLIQTIWQGMEWPGGGTSSATPIVASLVALLNDRLLAAGKPVLGFLNPLLYSKAARTAFNDITSGDNPGCNTTGFPSLPGWDPVTGLGTPDFDKLLAVLLPS
ncbi:family S53 protease-like protein [Mycena amicta]|nr:family S53 protease-like protein [Mycena amicta]